METLVQTDVWAVKIIRLAIGIVIGVLALPIAALGLLLMLAGVSVWNFECWVAND